MAATTGGVSLGDVVLHFTADLADLDSALARIQADTAAKLRPAGDAVTNLGKGFDQAATSATALGESIKSTAASTTQAASNAELLAQKLIAEGVSAKDTASALVNLGFSQKQAAAAAELAAQAVTKQASAVTALGTALGTTGQKAVTAEAAGLNAGKTLADAFKLIPTPIGNSNAALENMAFALRNVGIHGKAAGEEVARGSHKATEELQKGVATAGLFSEATGITLPRHVRTFIAELPILGAALSAAFNVAAIGFVIEAIVAAGEKIEEFEDKPRLIAEAWRAVGDSTADASREMRTALDDVEAKIIGLTAGPIAEMDFKIQHLGTSAQKVAPLIGKMGEDLVAALAKQDTTKFDILSFFLENSRDVTKRAGIFFRDLQSVINSTGNAAGIVALKAEMEGLDKAVQKTTDDLKFEKEQVGSLADALTGGDRAQVQVLQQKLDNQKQYREELVKTLGVVQQGIDLDAKAKTDLQLTKAKELFEQLKAIDAARFAAAKNTADAITDVELQQARIRNAGLSISYLEDARAEAQANEQKFQNTIRLLEQQRGLEAQKQQENLDQLQAVRGKEPKQVEEVNAQIEGVKNQYKAKFSQIDGEIVAAEKEHQAKQLANAAKFLEERQKLLLVQHAEIEKSLQTPQAQYPIDKVQDFTKATRELELADLKLAEAQTRLALTNVAQDFGPREAAVTALANFGIITEEEKAQRLRVLYKQEEDDALKALRDLDSKALADKKAAQAALDKIDPVGHQVELTAAQEYLDKVTAIYDRAEQQILSTTDSFEQKRIAVQRTTVAESIALARSEGKAQVVENLLYAQSQLDIINGEIREAQAHHQNTDALMQERKAREQSLNALVNEANRTVQLKKAIVELNETMKQFASDEIAAFSAATAAAISSQESFGKALEAGTLRAIGKLAQSWADYYAAMAIAEFWSGDYAAAVGHTAAAVAFEVVAGAAGGFASKIESDAQGSGGSSFGGAPAAQNNPPNPAQTPTQQPVSVVNTPHLAAGGLLRNRTMAVIGDAPSGGGSQREAIIPVDNPEFMDAVAGELAKRIGGGGGDTHIHIKGDMVDYNHAMRKMSRQNKKGNGRLTVSNSFRVTRRG